MQRLVFDTLTAAQARQLGSISTRISAAISPDPIWTPGAGDSGRD
ncbi:MULTISPECIES: hypothetical protein [Microbacterium]|nr:hypothetical protein [Microbacterium sp. Ag1]